MDIITATRQYETWLRKQIQVVDADIIQKHANMAEDPFIHLRATAYYWALRWPMLCPDLTGVSHVNSVRDLHIENFGTWRDSEGRLVWGVNDFDEAYPGPWTEDPTRLSTSVAIAKSCGLISVPVKDACAAILTGYEKGLRKGPSPFVLSHRHAKLGKMANGEMRDPHSFWQKMLLLPPATDVPRDVQEILRSALPAGFDVQFKTRRAGQGSLGHPRYVALADCYGGYIAREAKALTPSTAAFALGLDTSKYFYQETEDAAARSKDPFLQIRNGWIIRRLSPHCSRIELSQLKLANGFVLLKAMGRELANVHAAQPEVRERILDEFNDLPKGWLRDATETMCEDGIANWRVWSRYWRKAA